MSILSCIYDTSFVVCKINLNSIQPHTICAVSKYITYLGTHKGLYLNGKNSS